MQCCQNQNFIVFRENYIYFNSKSKSEIIVFLGYHNMNQYKVLNYFFRAVNFPHVSRLARLQQSSIVNCANLTTTRSCLSEVVSSENSKKKFSVLDPVDEIDLSDYGSAVLPRFNFAMYADKSPLVQKFIDLGVNLYEIEKRPQEAQFLITLSLEKIKPYLLFLCDNGVSPDNLGIVITKNPLIFKEDLDDLQIRINYLLSKKFDREMISTILKKNSRWLSIPVRTIDERLGFLQQTFKLKGDEVREMVVRVPKVALIPKKYLLTNIYALKEEMGLDQDSLKKIVVLEPCLLKLDPYDFISTYEYLIKSMNVPLALILKQPKVIICRKFKIKERHRFLESLGRAQYCNYLPGYVSLLDLVKTSDSEFCEKIAKTSVKLFYDFLKTL